VGEVMKWVREWEETVGEVEMEMEEGS